MAIAVGVGVGVSYLPSGRVVGGGAGFADQPQPEQDGLYLDYAAAGQDALNLLHRDTANNVDYIVNYEVEVEGLYLSYTDGGDDINLIYAGMNAQEFIINYREAA